MMDMAAPDSAWQIVADIAFLCAVFIAIGLFCVIGCLFEMAFQHWLDRRHAAWLSSKNAEGSTK